MPSRESERTVTCRNSEFPTKFSSFKIDGKEGGGEGGTRLAIRRAIKYGSAQATKKHLFLSLSLFLSLVSGNCAGSKNLEFSPPSDEGNDDAQVFFLFRIQVIYCQPEWSPDHWRVPPK